MIAPVTIEAMAQRLLTVALNLEEDAHNCAVLPDMRNVHSMLVSMREAHDALQASFRYLALR